MRVSHIGNKAIAQFNEIIRKDMRYLHELYEFIWTLFPLYDFNCVSLLPRDWRISREITLHAISSEGIRLFETMRKCNCYFSERVASIKNDKCRFLFLHLISLTFAKIKLINVNIYFIRTFYFLFQVVLVFVLSIASLIIYFIDASKWVTRILDFWVYQQYS